MRVCIDISPLPYGTGVSRYTANLTTAIANLPDINLSVFGSSMRQLPVLTQFAATHRIKHRLYPLPQRIITPLFSIYGAADVMTRFPEIFHAWDWYFPNTAKTTPLITIHDVALFKYPHIANETIKAHHQQVINQVKQRHADVIAVSESTKSDLIELFHLAPETIHVVHEALPIEQQITVSSTEIEEIREKYKLDKPYMLMVGTREPRKNHIKQIEAWRAFAANYDLVIVGKLGWQEIAKEPHIHLIDYVSGRDLAGLYRGASLLLFASLAEGFGLPILEAFFHHTPVVTSNRSSMAEIAADAAVLVNPDSSKSIKDGIEMALQNRNEYIAKSMSRLNDFSWSKAAEETVEVYRQVLAKRA
jgi:glycosyltransferase involved in cell wall biosynthesis